MSDPMNIKLNVLLVSRRKDALDAFEAALRKHPGLRIQRNLVVNGHMDPLHGQDTLPDALILHLGETWEAELQSLAARPADQRPPVIVVGSASGTNVMRLAMQAGARDLLPLPLVEEDLIAALTRINRDHRVTSSGEDASLTAFMNAKGGCGATLLACNVAHTLAAESRRRVALLDFDLQFGAIPLYFDLFPKRGVLQAFENIEGLDEVALDGYMVKHSSGLKILGHAAEDALPMQAVPANHVKQLLTLALRGHDHVVVDLPRRIDLISGSVLERAQQVVLVVQQSVTTLRDATRLVNCLRRDLGVSRDRIVTVVNRYDKNASITPEDIRTTLGCGELSLVPNDFRTVSQCIDTGAPLLEHARNAAITKAVMALETRLGGNSAVERPSLLARTFSGFTKSRSV
jgi:pilus assembly protein CpaE